jgi:hypothetical protein
MRVQQKIANNEFSSRKASSRCAPLATLFWCVSAR